MPIDRDVLNFGRQFREGALEVREKGVNQDVLEVGRNLRDYYAQQPPKRQELTEAERRQSEQIIERERLLAQASKELGESNWPGVKAYAIEAGADIVSPIARLTGHDEYADRMNRFADAVEQVQRKRERGGIVPDVIQSGVRGAGRSLTTMGAAGMAGGPAAAILAASGQEANRAITEGRDAGLKGTKLAGYAVSQGVIEGAPAAVMQKMGLGGVETMVAGKQAVAGGVREGLKRLGMAIAQEVPEELVTEISHGVAAKVADVDPEALTKDSLRQIVNETTVQTVIASAFAGSPGIVRQMSREKVARVTGEIVAYAKEGRVPSRKTWKKWGLAPEYGESRKQRRAFTEEVSKAFTPAPEARGAKTAQEPAKAQEAVSEPQTDADRAVAAQESPTVEPKKAWEVFKVGKTTVVKNPTIQDRQEISAEFREKYPSAPKGEPKTRSTTDSEGNVYLWIADKTHTEIEPAISRRYGTAVSQNPPVAAEPARVLQQRAIGIAGNLTTEALESGAPLPADGIHAPETAAKPGKRKKSPVASKARAAAEDLVSIASPVAAGGRRARRAGHILRGQMARAAQWDEASKHSLDKIERSFYKMSPDERLEFIDRMESGTEQPGELNAVAKVIRGELDAARERVQKVGKLEKFNEDYFPHLWKSSPEADTVLGQIFRKTYRKSGFLRKRVIPTVKEGREAGLELVTDNPAELAFMRIHHMNEYVAKTEAMGLLKQHGLAVFVPASLEKDYLPSGFRFVDDPAFLVQTSGDVTVTEAFDKLLVDQLTSVANSLGVATRRVTKLESFGETVVTKKGRRIIRTRVGTPVATLAHEIGHNIGEIYGLYDYMVESGGKAVQQELDALSSLRVERSIPETEGFVEYSKTPEEQEAVILEAWLATPEKMREIAPKVTGIWQDFLAANEPLSPLLMLDRSLVLGTQEQTIKQQGVRVLGRWAMPDKVAGMIENQLSPGLRANPNTAVRTLYNTARMYGNAMNQASLALSAFHGINVTTDAVATQTGVSILKLLRGDLPSAAAEFVTAPMAGFKSLWRGNKLIKAMRSDLSQIKNEKLADTIEDVIRAGGRASMDARYHNQSIKALRGTFYDLKFGGPIRKVSSAVKLPVQGIFATLEAAAIPVMEYMVPRLKLGTFQYLAGDIYSRSANLTEEQITEQLTQAWDSVDNRLGQLPYDNLFWNQYVKDVSMLAVRSVGWNLGSIREYGGAITDIFTTKERIALGGELISGKQAYVMGAAISYATLGAVLTYLFTGERPKELKDYFFPPTGNRNPDGSAERIGLPTYSRDVYSWTHDPARTAHHKVHPMWGTFADMWVNEDYYGTEIRNADDPLMAQLIDSVQHVGEAYIPFSVKNYLRMREAKEPAVQAAITSGLGITSAPAYITRSNAQKLAMQYLADKIPAGSRTREKAERSKRRKGLVRRFRADEEVTPEELEGFAGTERKGILAESRLTPLQASVKRLSLRESLDVFLQGTAEERKQLWPIIAAKRNNARTIDQELAEYYVEVANLFLSKE